jgi:hypothetical protein
MSGISMKRFFILFGITLIAACGGNDSDDFVDTAYIYARGINAMVDSPAQTFTIGPRLFISDLPFGNISPFSGFASFDTFARIQGRLPDLDRFEIDRVEGLIFQTGFEYTFVSTGYVDAPDSFVIAKQQVRRPFTEIYLQFAHASALQDELEFYLTAPDADLGNATPYATLNRTESTVSATIPEGEYQIRILRVSDGELIFDSDVLQFFRDPNAPDDRGGRDWLFCILDTAPSLQWPIQALLTDGASVFTLAGAGDSSSLRTRHVSRTLGNADVFIDGDAGNPLATNLAYLESSAHRALVPDEYLVSATSPGQPTNVLYEQTVPTNPGVEKALYLIDSEGAPGGIIQDEDRRSVITEGRLGIILTAPENRVVSVYVGYPEDVDVPNGDYGGLLINRTVPPRVFSRLARLPGSTLVTVTEWLNAEDEDATNDREEVALGPVEIQLDEGDVRTLLLVPAEAGSGDLVEAVVLDDL